MAAIAAHRRAQGDVVDDSNDRLFVGTTYKGMPTAAEVRWRESFVHVHAMLPLELTPRALSALTTDIMLINSKLAVPGFGFMETTAGFRIAFVGYAFLDEDKTLSARAFDDLLDVVRGNAAIYLPKFTARVAETAAAPLVTALAPFPRLDPRLTRPELDAIRAAVAREAEPFMPRLGTAMLAELEQPWFARSRLFEIVSPEPTPARSLYVAFAADGSTHVLSQRIAGFQALTTQEAPAGLDDRDAASAFATLVAVVSADETERRIASFDDLGRPEPLRFIGPRIKPGSFEATATGHQLEYWSVVGTTLLHRFITLTPKGEVDASTEVVAELPTS